MYVENRILKIMKIEDSKNRMKKIKHIAENIKGYFPIKKI